MSTKRPAEEPVPVQRRTRIKLASPSPERTSESDTESIHSCQGYKTELANDTSDTSSPPILQPYHTEYELADVSGENLKFYFSDHSSDQDNLQDELFNTASNDSLDNALLGDTSEENSTSPTSNSDVDPGLPRNDYLDFENCLLCRTDKKNISYPYCSNCFTWKKNLFPSRPKRHKKGLKRDSSRSGISNKNSLQSDKSNCNVLIENDKQGSLSDAVFEDSGVGSTEPQMSEDAVDGPSQPSTSSLTPTSTSNSSVFSGSEACRVCFLKPENGLFVHLNTAHRYGCYNCAKEIWYHNNGGCPLCRRKVFKVTKMYN